MTDPARPGRPTVDVRADLVLDVGGERVAVHGTGEHVVVETDDPGALWRQLTSVSLPPEALGFARRDTVGRIGDLLATSGLTATVTGPSGVLATVGRDADSALGRLATGSRHVRLGTWDAVGPTVRVVGADLLRGRRRDLLLGAALVAAVGAAVTAGVAGRRR